MGCFFQELRDENDELLSQIKTLKDQLGSKVKRRKSHRHRSGGKVDRVGSVLSDYTKPNIIRRNKDGMTSSDDEMDDTDAHLNVPSLRVSGDGGSEAGTFSKPRNTSLQSFSLSFSLSLFILLPRLTFPFIFYTFLSSFLFLTFHFSLFPTSLSLSTVLFVSCFL